FFGDCSRIAVASAAKIMRPNAILAPRSKSSFCMVGNVATPAAREHETGLRQTGALQPGQARAACLLPLHVDCRAGKAVGPPPEQEDRSMNRKRPQDLRSHRWLGVNDLRAFGHRSRLKQFGYDDSDWAGRPVIGIINTWSEINACHAHLRARAENVKRGVLQAGGFPIELPAMSLAEPFVKPSTML